MDLNLITVFVGIYETQSLTATAERLYVTQSAVSQSLARLRTSLKDELFVRSGRIMLPTPYAVSAYPQFRDALHMINQVTEGATAFNPTTTDYTFRIALSELGEVGWLANIVTEIRTAAPKARIETVSIIPGEVADWLRRGLVDIAVAPVGIPGDLKRTSVKKQGWRLVMDKSHPLADKEITLGEFADLPRVVIPSESGAAQLDAVQRGADTYREPVVVARHFASVPSILKYQPDLVTIVPADIAVGWAGSWPFVVKDLPLAMPPNELSVYQRSTSQNQAALEWLVQTVLRAIISLPEHFETLSGL